MKWKIVLIFLFSFSLLAENVFKVKIDGVIDKGLVPYVKRVVKLAQKDPSSYLLFEINTFGGRVDAAVALKDAILTSQIPTIAYVNKRAISAGALIALSCKYIIMSDGSSMGAATVVDQSGNKMSEKNQSYMRAEFGATAESYHRNRKIAEAMVDEDLEIEGIISKGKLLTFTAGDAYKNNFCDTIVSSEQEIYSYLKIENPVIKEISTSVLEKIVRFLTNPIVSSLLMSLGVLGLVFELKTIGWGVGGTVGIICLSLFFGAHYLVELANNFEIILFGVGALLILLEIFVIPGFGFFGISGILAVIASFMLSMLGRYPSQQEILDAGTVISISFFTIIIMIAVMIKFLPKISLFEGLINQDNMGQKEAGNNYDFGYLVGAEGVATTDLRLSGKGRFKDNDFGVISKNEYINKGEQIKVLKVEGNKITVTKINK